MIETRLNIKKWGNNLGVRLPAAIVKGANFKLDQLVNLSVDSGKVIIKPINNKFMSLDERLDLFTKNKQDNNQEIMTTASLVGQEKW